MKQYKCVIFDCDGVLVDSEPIGNQVMVDMANNFGAQIDLDYAYRHFKGNSLYKCMEHIEGLIEADLPKNFEAEYRRLSFKRFKNEIQPVDGVVKVLNNLKLPYCVASSGPENKIKLNLEATGLYRFFVGRIYSCYALNKWKPDPAVFLWAVESMGCEPEDCVVIEDSTLGVEAAIRGGFDVFGFTAHDYDNVLEQKVSWSFKHMKELNERLNYSQ